MNMLRHAPLPLRWAVLVLFLVGLAARLTPILLGSQWVYGMTSEDGYLMLTMSRNIALGNGMSISDGLILTNGTQPLATFLWSIGYWLFDGDKYLGVLTMQLMSIGIGLLGAAAVYRLTSLVSVAFGYGSTLAWAITGIWYASHITMGMVHNGLETGLYAALVLLFLLAFSRVVSTPSLANSWLSWAKLGALGGFVAWARIDVALLLIVAGAFWVLTGLRHGPKAITRRILQGLLMGGMSAVVIGPWLIYNHVWFGSIMPISGQAESMAAAFGSHFIEACSVMAIYFLGVLPVPVQLRPSPYMAAAGIAIVLTQVSLIIPLLRSLRCQRAQAIIVTGLLYTAALFAFYGLYFGATHFLPRYFFPIYPIGLLVTLLVLGHYLAGIASRLWQPALVTSAVLLMALNYRSISNMQNNGHMQVVQWVAQHHGRNTWVGAIQTGTLGYFHDRTVNLDGKVNPHALKARKHDRTEEYVLQTPIQVLADWKGIASWSEREPIKSHFKVAVHDTQANLAVLERKGALPRNESLEYRP